MVVRVLDTHKNEWSIMSPNGNPPPQRGGHSVRPFELLSDCCHKHNKGLLQSVVVRSLHHPCIELVLDCRRNYDYAFLWSIPVGFLHQRCMLRKKATCMYKALMVPQHDEITISLLRGCGCCLNEYNAGREHLWPTRYICLNESNVGRARLWVTRSIFLVARMLPEGPKATSSSLTWQTWSGSLQKSLVGRHWTTCSLQMTMHQPMHLGQYHHWHSHCPIIVNPAYISRSLQEAELLGCQQSDVSWRAQTEEADSMTCVI